MKIAPIFDPEKRREAPQAEQVDLHVVFAIGTGLWFLAAAVCGILYLLGDAAFQQRFIFCIWGMVIGILGLIWELNNRHIYRLLALMQQ
ncbi:DUF2530 domain-containing protein [Alloscardovia criceti]|uniref:DUF2530 domain-containing protein n=1 Tax=Alloscardovia criceti TaxID=356828 RepID=UPI00037CDF29|nr:DUF2530 domain-containing protein [Alloscardovia criceti]